jgi:hypothetical protein
VLYYSLRNSPRILTYADEDYGYWMRQAIDDVNRALLLAEEEQRAAMDQVGFRYWRGRLQFSLALTWQRKLRGLHSWSELVPLYSQAVDDFSVATNDDTELRRQAEYLNLRLPWARFMLNNATHMQQAERAIQAGEYQIARHELELVAPLMTPEQKRSWDRLGEPRPEYSIAHGLTSLALGEPADFINLQTKQSGALASFEQAITDADRDEIIDPRYRSAFYVQLLLEFDTLLQKGLPAESQATANVIQAKLHEAAARAPKPEELIVQGR